VVLAERLPADQGKMKRSDGLLDPLEMHTGLDMRMCSPSAAGVVCFCFAAVRLAVATRESGRIQGLWNSEAVLVEPCPMITG